MDAQNDEALRGANVVLRHNDTIIRGSATDGDGFFAFNDIASGVYALQASFLGYVTSRDSVTLAEGEIRTIRVFNRHKIVFVRARKGTPREAWKQ